MFERPLPERPDRFERSASGALRVGAATVDITPADESIYLGGFDLAREATGVHSRLKARALYVEVGGQPLVIVGVDNLGLLREDVDWIKAGIRGGIANGEVVVCASHTHAAPDLIGLWGWYLVTTGRDPDYLAHVRRSVAAAIDAARAAAVPARFVHGRARLDRSGPVRNSNRAGVFDPRVVVLQARALDDDRPVAALLHLACHPEALRRRNTLISADMTGDLCDRWDAAGLGEPVFVNGALGAMITPTEKGVDGVARAGQQLFEVASAALDAAEPLEANVLEIRRSDVYLPLESDLLALGRLFTVIPRHTHAGCVRTTVGWLRLGSFEACLVPGEAEPGWASRLRALTRRPNLVLFGLADDEIGYVLSERDARDPLFDYERGMSPGPRTGELLLRALAGRTVPSVTASR